MPNSLNFEETYDYIVVGAGAAGCVVANRLSADPNVKDDFGKTPLHELLSSFNFSTNEGVKERMLACLDVLLGRDGLGNEPVNLEAKCSSGFSALNYAVSSGMHISVMKYYRN